MDVNELLAIAQSNATLNNENTEELRDTLLSLLPPLEDMRVENIDGSVESFVAESSVNMKTKEAVASFLEKYCSVNKEELRIAKTV